MLPVLPAADILAADAPRLTRGELLDRAARARDMLTCCTMCEHRCRADRTRGQPAPCGLGSESFSFKRHVSYAEELELLPSYMVYFAGCNFRCSFCVQAPTCFNPRAGKAVDPASLAAECSNVVDRGARSINLLGGEPSLHLHTILELAAAAWPRGLPLVLNSNFYMTPEVLDLLDGVIDIALADLKFGNDACASRIAKVDRYFEVVTRNILTVAASSRLMLRHLLMPGHLDCCLRPAAQWAAANVPGVPFNLMTSYVPAWQTARFNRAELSTFPDRDEVDRAERLIRELGLKTGELE